MAISSYFTLAFRQWPVGQSFDNVEDLKTTVLVQFQDGRPLCKGVKKLLQRYEKCLEVNGAYVEKRNSRKVKL